MAVKIPSDEVSDWFWAIIERARRDRERLIGILWEFSESEIRRFCDEFQAAAVELHDLPYTEHMGDDDVPEVSEDTMQDVSECVVSQEKEYYLEVLRSPEDS